MKHWPFSNLDRETCLNYVKRTYHKNTSYSKCMFFVLCVKIKVHWNLNVFFFKKLLPRWCWWRQVMGQTRTDGWIVYIDVLCKFLTFLQTATYQPTSFYISSTTDDGSQRETWTQFKLSPRRNFQSMCVWNSKHKFVVVSIYS